MFRIFLLAAAAFAGCKRSVDLVHIMNKTPMRSANRKVMHNCLTSLQSKIEATFDAVHFGVATFTDKPLPWLGWGFGEVGSVDSDYCYRLMNALGPDMEFDHVMQWNMQGGNDDAQNVLGAMLQTARDPDMGWKHDTKFVLVTTQSTTHFPGDAQANLIAWNRSWGLDEHLDDDPDTVAPSRYPSQLAFMPNCIKEDYLELGPKIVAPQKYGRLVLAEKGRAENVERFCGPRLFPYIKPHHGSVESNDDCETLDYPSAALVGRALNSNGIKPVVVVSETGYDYLQWLQWSGVCSKSAENDVECLKEYWSRVMATVGVDDYLVVCADEVDAADVVLEFMKRVARC
ncbi:MAG: uncharacterized protein KVP18_002612 [Porospora cf. gigantea A]|uniref:uncharacterized protein n=1 Tax=Porospora cf. gigantea A TaxID=2853593 RepID=UPI00355A4D45|nr:MAG: hypothetical protein KVP18_002612 [Porospora cf. gigantea A]